MRLILIVLLPFLGALLPMLLARAGRRICAVGTGLFTLTALALLVTFGPEVIAGNPAEVAWPWIESLGMNFEFRIDGLALLMAGLILGIGLLIIIYAKYYLGASEPVGQFFTYLLVFQGAMVGISLSNNLLLLLIFWELTSLASFLLIGFWRHLEAGRQGARMALVVTGSGGLALTGGLLMLGHIAGSYNIQEVIANADVVKASPWYPLMLVLIALGCFTKSAQFPFHFWLPRAMAAPTPVSAYLHSATMVKAGIFLLARLWPVLAGTDLWFYLITSVGLLTLLYGSITALFKDDLKALMAYSTISHLGLMTMLLGLGTQAGVIAAMFHLLNHAIFKASLFMNVGIIDHGTGTRLLPKLGGLFGWMPITAVMALLAITANAGLPPMNGFLSKELLLEESWHTEFLGLRKLLAGLVILASLFAIAYSLRFFIGVYLGSSSRLEHEPHAPEAGLAFSPTVLALAALAVGLFPGALAEPLMQSTVQAVTASIERPDFHFHMWHGWNKAVYSSIAAVVLGVLLYMAFPIAAKVWSAVFRINGKSIFDWISQAAVKSSQAITNVIQHGSLADYLAIMLTGCLVFSGMAFFGSTWSLGHRPTNPVNPMSLLMFIILVASAVAACWHHRNRLISFIAANVAGLMFCIGFIYLSAPDLALTQMSVEVVTLILILLAMFFLPQFTPAESSLLRKSRDILLAVVAGLAMTGLTYVMLRVDLDRSLANYFIEQAKPAGGGSNVVNVILVDFRGFDTFNEIAVLGLAALAIYSLLDGAMFGPASDKLDHWDPDTSRTPEKHPKMLMVPTRVLLPMALLVASYMFLRGHNEPGGGFVAGLVATIALVIQYMVSGYRWADERISIDAHAWIGLGLLLAAGTGFAAVIIDDPFLTNYYNYVPIPGLGKIGISSALFFDAGVLMAVVGAMMLTLANLARLGRRAERAAAQAAREKMAKNCDPTKSSDVSHVSPKIAEES